MAFWLSSNSNKNNNPGRPPVRSYSDHGPIICSGTISDVRYSKDLYKNETINTICKGCGAYYHPVIMVRCNYCGGVQ